MNLTAFFSRRLGAIILLGVIGYSLVYALAFIGLYSREHPYKLASEWIFANVPAGSRIFGPHWDDRVPVGIPGHDVSIYKMNGRDSELPFYERDTPQMIDLLVKRIASADYLTFATPRIADSIPRIPDEYPNTTALLRLLWGEKIGFKLVHTTKNRPSFLGFVYNDDLADESFSVYDHPKVVVFANEEHLSPEEIADRIKRVADFEPLPNMNQMLLMDRGGWLPREGFWRPEWGDYLKVLGVSILVGASFWVLFCGCFRFLPDTGLGVSALLGSILFASLGWGGSLLGITPLTRSGGIFVVAVLFLLAALKLILREPTRHLIFKGIKSHGVGFFVAVIIGAVVVIVMRGSDSALLSLGGKVDSDYLAYLMRTEDPRPWDLFNPGKKLSLVFFDRFIIAWILKISGTPISNALNVSYVLLGGVMGGVLYTVLVAFLGRVRPTLVGVLLMSIPAVYLIHVARDITNKPLGNFYQTPPFFGAENWSKLAQRYISGTPLIVEACDQEQKLSVAVSMGLPRYVEPSGVSVDAKLCSIQDAMQAYDRMFGLSLEFFLTPNVTATTNSAARSRYEAFVSRPDLFARVFEDQSLALFVPAFSRYYTELP